MAENDKTMHSATADAMERALVGLEAGADNAQAYVDYLRASLEMLRLAHEHELEASRRRLMKYEGPVHVEVNGNYVGVASDATWMHEIEEEHRPLYAGGVAERSWIGGSRMTLGLKMDHFDVDALDDPNSDYYYN